MGEKSLIDLGDLSKPATVLIEKISDAVGGIFKPYQVVRVAKAEAEAEKIHEEARIQVTDLHRRAMHRFLEEEAKMQSNIENITKKALPLLEEDSSPQNVEDDWITNFFDKSRIVSDEDMQLLWSKVLAEESNAPGFFSRRTVNLMADLDKGDAELFMSLSRFTWGIGELVPLVYDVQDEIYNSHEINFDTLHHLESLGLVQFNNIVGFKFLKLPKQITASYHDRPVELTFQKDEDNELSVGKVLLTRAGSELTSVCDPNKDDAFFDFIYDDWARQSLVPKRTK